MKVVTGADLQDYFMSHVKKTKRKSFYIVVKPLHVFKKTTDTYGDSVIVNLILPVGSVVYANDVVFSNTFWQSNRKMRCSKAYVHSQCTANKKTNVLYSHAAGHFHYITGHTVKPTSSFSMKDTQCKSGIHFFLNLQDALEYGFL